MTTRSIRVMVAALAAYGLLISGAAAQTSGVGTIQGRVTDETGAILPGVSVSVSSPAMQLPRLTEFTDAAGAYRFVELPIGTYRIHYELAGFQGLIREDLRLTSGFVARVDVVLKVGSLDETITVSGRSPIVDVSTTSGVTTIAKETLETASTTRSFGDVLSLAAGLRPEGVDIGGSGLDQERSGVQNYGTQGQITPMLDGINTRQATGSQGNYYDYNSVEEAEIKAVGNDAEIALPGAAYSAVIKSGGNQFHGRYIAAGQTSGLQSSNVDDDLRALGVDDTGSSIKWFREFAGDLGGRIVRDKLWFYGGIHDQRNEYNAIGFAEAPGPDGVYQTADDVLTGDKTGVTNKTLKLTQQVSAKYKLIGLFARNEKLQPNGQTSGQFEPLSATYDYNFPTRAAKGEITGTPSPRVLFSAMFGRQWYDADRYPQEGENRPGNPRTLDRETGLNLGPPGIQLRPRSRWQSTGSVSFFPESFLGGSHSFKAGYQLYRESFGTAWLNMESGDYRLLFDRVNGVPHQPVEMEAFNNPVTGTTSNRDNMIATYLQDKWTLGRWTVNLGLRWERYHAFVDEQTKEQGTFGEAGQFPYIDVLTWRALAPRAGVAWDLEGNGTSVVKATYGWFNHFLDETYPSAYNKNQRVTYRYRWTDRDGNGDYTPGEVNLDVNSGGDFISVTGATNNINNPDLEQPRTHEISLSYERQIVSNFSARALYVYKRENNNYTQINILRPYSAYDIPITRRDPGPDGVLNNGNDGSPVTLYDYNPAFRGSDFVGNIRVNAPDNRDNNFHTFELMVNKRMSNRWDLMASSLATKQHRWINPVVDNPNQDLFPLDETWTWHFKASATYQLPWGVYTSAWLQSVSGEDVPRTYIFRQADPDGGTPLRQLSTVTLRLEDWGERRLPTTTVVNWKASKRFGLRGAKNFETAFDLYNALNVNTVTSMNVASGPTFGSINFIVPPRVARITGIFSF